MRIELVELLRTRKICHPSRFVSLKSGCDGDIQIEVNGYPWWFEEPSPSVDQKITFHIEGISDGCLEYHLLSDSSDEEYLESFDARLLSDHDWAKGIHGDIYCSAPLPNPLDIYFGLHDFLLSIGCPYRPEDYLNMGNARSLDEFVAIASSKSFLLCNAPDAIRKFVCDELKKFGAEFNVVRGRDRSNGRICVRISDSFLICRTAYAVFED